MPSLPSRMGRHAWVVVLLVLVVACGDPMTMPPIDEGPLQIGLAYDLLSPTSQIEGALLAGSELNAAGGIRGRQIELIPIDTKGDPVPTREAFEEFVRDYPDAVAAVGPLLGFPSLFAAPIAHREQLPLLTVGGSYLSSWEQANPGDDRYAYGLRMSREDEARFAGRAAREELGCQTALFIVGYNRGAEIEIVSAFEEELRMGGGELVGWEVILPGFADYRAVLTPYVEDPPQCVFMGIDEIPAIQAINAWRDVGGPADSIPVYMWDVDPDLLQRFLVSFEHFDSVYAMGQEQNAEGPAGIRFRENYRATFGEDPGQFAGARYDMVALMGLALARATSFEGPAVRDALLEVGQDNSTLPSEGTYGAGQLGEAIDQIISRGTDIYYQGASGEFQLGANGVPTGRSYNVYRLDDLEDGIERVAVYRD